MISLIVFSRDRAFQLEALLSSLKVNCNIFDQITVIVKHSNNDFLKGYQQIDSDILNNCDTHIRLMRQHNFKSDVLKSFNIPARIDGLTYSEYTCFMVDDLIAYTRQKIALYIEGFLECVHENTIFSLRLGSNIKHCPYIEENLIAYEFQWEKQTKYWTYPFSLDGHIFRTDFIKPIIEKINFTNPNKLESHLQKYKKQAPKYMSCFNQSVVVSNPINRVSDTATASYGEKYPHTAKELNDRFLNGERMDWENMCFDNINMPHQEIELKFKKI